MLSSCQWSSERRFPTRTDQGAGDRYVIGLAIAFAILWLLLAIRPRYLEWGAAVVFGGNLGVAYVGSQGDPWDAQKDMGLAALGALLSTLTIAAVHRWRDRNARRDRLPHPSRRG